MTGKRILLVGGSLNQTTMMHRIAEQLPGHECFFSRLYADGWLGRLAARGALDFTTLGGQARRRTEAYLAAQGLATDHEGRQRPYDLVVLGTDLVLPRNLRGRKVVLVQEGMTDPEGWRYHLVRALRLPRVLANTAATGLSHAYLRFCVASEGYRDLFAKKGVDPRKLVVTGIPNFDDARSYLGNSFEPRGYVLGATSCLRETLKYENRPAFIAKVLRVAGRRPVLFKLHPNEDAERATREIRRQAPRALVFAEGNTNHMIANCEALVTRYSSVVYVALALDKEVHADLPLSTLRRLAPWQNGGDSARRIAAVCEETLAS